MWCGRTGDRDVYTIKYECSNTSISLEKIVFFLDGS